MLAQFIAHNYVAANGHSVSFPHFCGDFQTFLFNHKVNPVEWPPQKIRDELEAAGFVVGLGSKGRVIGNLLDLRHQKKRWIKIDKYQLRKQAIAA